VELLTRINDPVRLQVLCDALRARGIAYSVDHAGMHALMPLPDVMDVRLMVEAQDMAAARRVLADVLGDVDA